MFGYIIYLVEQTWNGLSVPYCSPLGKQACRYSEEPYSAAMPRELVWIDQPGFRGWGLLQMCMGLQPSGSVGPPTGDTFVYPIDCRDANRSSRNTSSVSSKEDWIPRYNVAPTQPVPILLQHPKEPRREMSLVRWGRRTLRSASRLYGPSPTSTRRLFASWATSSTNRRAEM